MQNLFHLNEITLTSHFNNNSSIESFNRDHNSLVLQAQSQVQLRNVLTVKMLREY